jgi:hypothetical protein
MAGFAHCHPGYGGEDEIFQRHKPKYTGFSNTTQIMKKLLTNFH